MYEPKFGRVLIEREKLESKGTIIIPDSAAKRLAPCIGTIIALGETAGWTETYAATFSGVDKNNNPIEEPPTSVAIQTLKVGDKVLFGRHAGAWIDATDKEEGNLYICQDADILAVIKE